VDLKTGNISKRGRLALLLMLIAVFIAIVAVKFSSPILIFVDELFGYSSTSPWYEREKSIYRQALANQEFDIVISQFQAEPESLDRVSRSLMTRYLANEIQARSDLRVPDTTWVNRALGSNLRQISIKDAKALTESVGARYLIEGRVSRPNAVNRFNLEFSIYERDAASRRGAWKEPKQWIIEDIEFSDELPPEEAFHESMEAVLGTFGIPLRAKQEKRLESLSFKYDGQPLLEIAKKAKGTPLDRALMLQLFASLYPDSSYERELLWERSLVALEAVHPDSDLFRLLKSRANANLHRRPYALKILGEPETEMEKSHYWFLQGSMYLADQANSKIEDPVLNLISTIELEGLRRYFDRQEGYMGRRKEAEEKLPAWKFIVNNRLSTADWFDGSIHYEIQKMLQKEGLEPEPDWDNWIVLLIGVQLNQYDIELPDFLTDFTGKNINAIEHTRRLLWEQRAKNWSSVTGDRRLQEWDYFDLVYAINMSSAFKTVSNTTMKQGLPKEARTRIDTLQDAFEGRPNWHMAKALVSWQLAKKPEFRNKATRLRRNALQNAKVIQKIVPGEGYLSRSAEWYFHEMGHRNYGKYYDEPIRWDRRYMQNSPSINKKVSYGDEAWRRQLAYAVKAFDTLEVYYKSLMRSGRDEEAQQLLEENRDRFIGSRFWAKQFLAPYKGRQDDDAIAAIEKGLAQDPNVWRIRRHLATKLIDRGEYARAQRIILDTPGFSNREFAVYNTNKLSKLARLFESKDQFEMAIPLYKIAAAYNTHAWNDYYAKERLAFLSDNYADAAKFAKQNADHYKHSNEKERYLAYLFLLNRDDEAWNYLTTAFINPKKMHMPKYPVRIGFKINQSTREQVLDWLRQRKSEKNEHIPLTRLESLYFLTFVVGQQPTPQDIKTIEQLNKEFSGSEFIRNWFTGYGQFRRGECKKASSALKYANDYLIKESQELKKQVNYALPYYVGCLLKTNRAKQAYAEWKQSGDTAGTGFYHATAEALLEGYQGNHVEALKLLETAYEMKTRPKWKPIETGLHLVEIAEELMHHSGRNEYRKFILKVARTTQARKVTVWAPAVEIQYDKASLADQSKLARAIFMDPSSYRLKGISPREINSAKRWLRENQAYY